MNHRMLALGRLKTGEMNRTEAAYAEHLRALQAVGKVQWHRFEGMKLRLADNTFYTPDFAVMAADGVMECHEVKGHWQDDARAKIKIAAAMYPFRFIAVKDDCDSAGVDTNAVVASVVSGCGGVVCPGHGHGTGLGAGRTVDTPRPGTANDEVR